MTRPYVLINVAASADGKIDTVERRGAPISSDLDRQRVDALRASVDAVMVGSRTLLDEDPRLVVRSADLRAERISRGESENPAKVGVLSQPDLLRPDSRFLTVGPARIIVFTPDAVAGTSQPDAETQQNQVSWSTPPPNVEVYPLGAPRVDLVAAMQKLGELDVARVLVEGGGTLNFELLRLGLVDEVNLFVAPLIFGGASAPTLADGLGLPRDQAIKLTRIAIQPWEDGGVLLRYIVEQS
jgi:2,5-diamino-6-(ribosylamino)-4(3H)-pyrimidinone 5'-phosphate reductase